MAGELLEVLCSSLTKVCELVAGRLQLLKKLVQSTFAAITFPQGVDEHSYCRVIFDMRKTLFGSGQCSICTVKDSLKLSLYCFWDKPVIGRGLERCQSKEECPLSYV